jgi:transglutaminase-like putative cysteine protease
MYDITQFRAALYLLLAIGISGFSIAAQEPGLWAFSMSLLLINWWLIKTGRFVPLPRIAAAALTFAALLYICLEIYQEVYNGGTAPVLIIGEFLVLLHLVKLYEQRANRDYAQMLVLSLLLMAASSISTASLLFGILLVTYLLVSLYCSLLFHLKVEADAAKKLLGQRQERINPAVLRQDQRRLSGSMRRLTALVSVFSIVMAVAVFLFFPRSAAEGLLGHHIFPAQQVLGGFNDTVSLDHVAKIGQSEEIVAQVKVTHLGKPWGGTEPLLLRGTTLDHYSGPEDESQKWQWDRTVVGKHELYAEVHAPYGQRSPTGYVPPSPTDFIQEVTLQPTETRVVFAMAGATALAFPTNFLGRVYPRDGAIMCEQPPGDAGIVRYTIWSSGELPVDKPSSQYKSTSHIDDRITAVARRPEVSGEDQSGRPLAGELGTPDAPTNINRQIAQSMQAYLRSNYKYTTDLTPDREIFSKDDPMVVFLVNLKYGHCEFFAGAMTLMCQSLGVPARMVVGYRSDEFNTMGQYYTVRRSHAHAWVEVLNGDYWETFDPTSSTELIAPPTGGVLAEVRNFFDYLDYRWGTAVVAYGQENRDNLVHMMDYQLARTIIRSIDQAHRVPYLVNHLPEIMDHIALRIAHWVFIYPSLVGDVMMLMGLFIVVLIVYYYYSQYQLRRRALRIGLAGLPGSQRRQLARQLGFYDDLLRLLEKRGIVPPPQLTPLEFSRQLEFLPNQAYNDIRRLTRLFYRIRYGGAVLNADRHRRLDHAIVRLDEIMGVKKVRRT